MNKRTIPLPGIDSAQRAVLGRGGPILWINPSRDPADDGRGWPHDPATAQDRFARCASLMAQLFPELAATHGALHSALTPIPRLQATIDPDAKTQAWLLKRDDALPVAGSVKARGGFHEVLALVERIVADTSLATAEATQLASPAARELFSAYTLSVGSTGNLGLSIGLIGAGLGLHCVVHMSAEAKAWKKQRLRARGIEVIEHTGDYAAAVASGRAAARDDPRIHFVDDEQSADLFLGYAAAASELAAQLAEAGRPVDPDHPLFVYLPCGVGGAPGGIAYGLKRLFGPDVHCFFAEPTASPCMLIQLAAGPERSVSVYDIGLDNHSEADGLTVAQASPLVAPIMRSLLSGVFTIDDDTLLRDTRNLYRDEGIFIEPSAAAALRGPLWLTRSPAGKAYIQRHHLAPVMSHATHVIWSTGGSLVPEEVRRVILGQ